MKRLFFCISILFIFQTMGTAAAFESGSTGADGTFNPTTNTVLQLPANGVFNFTTVNIPAGVTVTFGKNANNTPVVLLATGDVTIAGTVSLDGGSVLSSTKTIPGPGGPGGFGGGFGGPTAGVAGQGLGPGGGGAGPYNAIYDYYCSGGGGGYGTAGGKYSSGAGASGGPIYGNDRILPLIGGSGGGGRGGMNSGPGPAGAGGGGAILIASSATITVTGAITANGGNGYSFSGGGSGGAIKLMANSISGNGLISARGGLNSGMGILGGEGRIRLEAYAISRSAGTDPEYTYGGPESVFVPNIPVLSITSIAGVSAPATPTGSYSLPDVLLPNTTVNPVTVTLSASNIPVGTTVIVSVIPVGGGATNVNTTLSGTLESSSASANVNISTGIVSVIMASATFTIQASMHWEGEKIEKAIARAAPGKKSETIFITESGKQVNAAKVFAGTMRAN